MTLWTLWPHALQFSREDQDVLFLSIYISDFSTAVKHRHWRDVPSQVQLCSLTDGSAAVIPVLSSLVLVQEEAGNVLVDHKGYAAGRSDSDQVGHHAFVETHQALVSDQTPGERHKLSIIRLLLKNTCENSRLISL